MPLETTLGLKARMKIPELLCHFNAAGRYLNFSKMK